MTKSLRYRAIWIAVLFGMSLMFASPVWGHNSWLVASENSAAEPCTVRVAFVTTEEFPISEYATRPARVDEWIVRLGQSVQHVKDFRIEGKELAVEIPLDQAGVHVIAASLHAHFMGFEAGTFEEYLKEEHATDVLALRHSKGRRDKTGRMYYTKLTKTFVEIGDDSTEDYQRPVGHTLEIIPLSNPCHWQAGSEVGVRVLYEGKPAANFRVSSGYEGLPKNTYIENVFTDSDGLARFKLTHSGLWFFRTHHIRPAKQASVGGQQGEKNSPHADWESFWSSMTFRVDDKSGK